MGGKRLHLLIERGIGAQVTEVEVEGAALKLESKSKLELKLKLKLKLKAGRIELAQTDRWPP